MLFPSKQTATTILKGKVASSGMHMILFTCGLRPVCLHTTILVHRREDIKKKKIIKINYWIKWLFFFYHYKVINFVSLYNSFSALKNTMVILSLHFCCCCWVCSCYYCCCNCSGMNSPLETYECSKTIFSFTVLMLLKLYFNQSMIFHNHTKQLDYWLLCQANFKTPYLKQHIIKKYNTKRKSGILLCIPSSL